MKQTAVEYLIQAFDLTSEHPLIKDVVNKAKEMERQQIIEAFDTDEIGQPGEISISCGTQYYNQTYGGPK